MSIYRKLKIFDQIQISHVLHLSKWAISMAIATVALAQIAHNAQYQAAYSSCMRSKGYRG